MSPDEMRTLVTWLLSESGELAVAAKTLDTEAGRPYATTVHRIFRRHTVGLVRRYASMMCPDVPASTVRRFEDLFGETFDEATSALDRLNSEILRR